MFPGIAAMEELVVLSIACIGLVQFPGAEADMVFMGSAELRSLTGHSCTTEELITGTSRITKGTCCLRR